MPKKETLEVYAGLIAKMGINPKKDQEVHIVCDAQIYEFAGLVVKKLYQYGAGKIRVDFSDPTIAKLQFKYQTKERLAKLTEWEILKQKEKIETLPALVYLTSESPYDLQGIDPEKMAYITNERYPILKPIRDAIDNKYQWCIAGVPSKEWAAVVFKDDPNAYEKLWDAILKTMYIKDGMSEEDAIKHWQDHNKRLHSLAAKLNDYKFNKLHYKNDEGTNFTVALNPQVRWASGSEKIMDGTEFNPNMPTEEVFTTPLYSETNGIIYATKPLNYSGNLIDEFWIEFKDGLAVNWDAKVGKEYLDLILNFDEGSKKLGEVALVAYDTPINLMNILFYQTLYDENASCHVALGQGFENLLEGYEQMSPEEHLKNGINESRTHVDFMIGSKSLNINGELSDGSIVPIFKDGNWCI